MIELLTTYKYAQMCMSVNHEQKMSGTTALMSTADRVSTTEMCKLYYTHEEQHGNKTSVTS